MSSSSAEPSTAERSLILGLGNPGERYRQTRHNLGFRVVEELARRRRVALDRSDCRSRIGGDAEVLLATPQTYMNRSGYAARCLVEKYGFDPERILVVYDDAQLSLGRIRLRPAGSAGGHRGMESVIHNLRTDRVPRLRLGIGDEDGPEAGQDLVEFVLSPFRAAELPAVDSMIERAAAACDAWLREGAEVAMCRFNG